MEHVFNGLWAERYLMAGALAAALSVGAMVPYVRDIIAGRTLPDRACWLIWAVLSSLSGASNLYEGAQSSMVFVGAQVALTVLVFILSIWFGSGQLMHRGNLAVLALAGAGLVSWSLLETSVYALIVSIGVSALGGCLTLRKVYCAPHTETRSVWWVLLASAVLGTYSVGALDVMLLAYPVYLVVLYAAILAAQYAGLLRQQGVGTEAKLERLTSLGQGRVA